MFTIAIALLFTASAAEAEAAAGAERPAAEATASETSSPHQDVEKSNAKPKKICRKVTGTGSRLTSGTLCKTEEQWKRFFAQ